MTGRFNTGTLVGFLVGLAFLSFATAADARHPHKHRSGRNANAARLEFGIGKSARGDRQQNLFSRNGAPMPNAAAVLQQMQGPDF
jgi:hypothetical protein